MLDIPLLLSVLFFATVLGYWYKSHGIKDRALLYAKQHCQKLDLKLLDDSIVMRRHWFKKNDEGKWQFWRTYQFEFTSLGDDRYRGQIHLLGMKVLAVDLEAHRVE